jgi:hypothetical protein
VEHANRREAGLLQTPSQRSIANKDPFFHGNYESVPYLSITGDGAVRSTSSLDLITDEVGFSAKLVPQVDQPGVYNILLTDQTTIGTLSVCSVEGLEVGSKTFNNSCFHLKIHPETAPVANAQRSASGSPLYFPIRAVTADTPKIVSPYALESGTYRIAQPKDPHTDYADKLGSVFVNFPGNLEAAKACYNVVLMDPEDFQQTGCNLSLFSLPAGDSFRYEKMTVNGNHAAAVPYGWLYGNRIGARGQEKASILETGSEVNDAFDWGIGVEAKVNSFFFHSSFHMNQKVKSKTEQMYKDNLTYVQSDFFKTGYVLVLDKLNVTLDARLNDSLSQLKRLHVQKQLTKEDFQEFFRLFGTHYPYATTYGARGRYTNTLTRSEVTSATENGIDLSVGASAGLSFGEEFGASVGVDYNNSSDHLRRLSRIQSTDRSQFSCVGGDECHKGQASGTALVPVLLDLRPISELLGPPFFTDAASLSLRTEMTAAIQSYGFQAGDQQTQPHTTYLKVEPPKDSNQLGVTCRSESLPPGARGPNRPPGDRSRVAFLMDSAASACCPQKAVVTDVRFASPKTGADPSAAKISGSGMVPFDLSEGVFAGGKDAGQPLVMSATIAFNPIDFNKHCQSLGRRAARNKDGTSAGWRCIAGSKDEPIDVKAACVNQYGPQYQPRLTSTAPGDANDWTCARDNASFEQYCWARGFAIAKALNHTWMCETKRADLEDRIILPFMLPDSGGRVKVSMEHLCTEQFGPGYFPQQADPNDDNSWYCDAGLASVRQFTGSAGLFQKPAGDYRKSDLVPLLNASGELKMPSEVPTSVAALMPLQWDEVGQSACSTVDIYLLMNVSPASAKDLLAPTEDPAAVFTAPSQGPR